REHGRDLERRSHDVDRVDHPTRPRDRQDRLRVAVGVQGKSTDTVAVAYAHLAQRSGEPRNPVGLLGEGTGPSLEDRCDAVGLLLQRPMETLGPEDVMTCHCAIVTGATVISLSLRCPRPSSP